MKTPQGIFENEPVASATAAAAKADHVSWLPVLLVENDDADTFLFHRALRQVGGPALPCHAVSSVAEARRWLNELFESSSAGIVPRLVVCDLRLREGTSFELIEWMQGRAEFREVPVAVWGGAIALEDQKHAERGDFGMPTKSGCIDPLADWLRSLLRGDRARSGARLDSDDLEMRKDIPG